MDLMNELFNVETGYCILNIIVHATNILMIAGNYLKWKRLKSTIIAAQARYAKNA